MVDVGAVALVAALVTAVYAALGSFVGAWSGSPELVKSARYGLFAVLPLLMVATTALVYAFVTRDFQVRYVAENSSLAMPRVYTWVAFYAGNAGSLLYLALLLSLLSTLAVLSMRRRLPVTTSYATGMLAVVLTFFLGVMVFMANPLEKLAVAPLDGRGINPLLIHLGMFFHPPMQMAGLMSVTVPFSIAIGALLAGKAGQDDWVDVGRRWGLVSWLILTTGVLLGSWWAYTILGWGGYWGWDVVENSALVPWLAMTAFVHTIMVQRRRGMFRLWNLVLVILAFTLAQYGMFLNRGGPVPSVHSFAQSAMGWTFLGFMAAGLFGTLGLLFWKASTLKSREGVESLVSRESAFLLNNVLLLAVAFVTLWGSVFPLISQVFRGETVTVGAPFYNKVNGPLILALVFLMGVGPLLPWRRASGRQLLLMLKYPLGVATAGALALGLLGVRHPLALFAFAVCLMVATGILQEWARGTRVRHRRGEGYVTAFLRLLASNRPRYGGYLVHLGIVTLAIGVTASSFYVVQRDYSLAPGQAASLGPYTFRYLSIERQAFSDRMEVEAVFEVSRNGAPLGTMTPSRAFYPSFNIGATRAAIHSTPIEDFYIVPSQFDETGRGVFRVYIFPLVWWMWASGPVLVLGILVALWAESRPGLRPAETTVGARTAGIRTGGG